MAKSFSVLYVTSELYPYAKECALADVAYSLPLAMREIGHDIRVMLPKYGTVSERKNKIHEINRLKDLPIPIGDISVLATVKSTSISSPRVKVQAYITTNVNYLDENKGICRDVKSGKLFPDNDERFIFFCKTVIETCLILGWCPDIIHVNDWQTALVAIIAKVLFPTKFKKTKTVLTIHDFSKQGEFPESTFEKTGLPADIKSKFIHNGKFNFLKGAISYVDVVNTVSPTYAQEILQDTKYSNGLEGALLEKGDKFSGISNAMDPWVWGAKVDNEIVQKYTNNFGEFKKKNRDTLLAEFNLDVKSALPVVNVLGPFEDHKGTGLLIDSMEELMKRDILLLFMGESDPEMKVKLKKLQKLYPKKLAVNFTNEIVLSHKIIAGSDLTLIPSVYEPSSTNGYFNLSNGTIPVARTTGAHLDFLKDYDSKEKTGNAFTYSDLSAESLLNALDRALAVFKNTDEWEKLAVNAINQDYSWEESAKKYDDIYRSLMKD